MEEDFKISMQSVSLKAHGRALNEDLCVFREDKKIFALADGFGGPGCGDRAASEACNGVMKFLEKEAFDSEATMPFVLRSYYSLGQNVLFNAILHANRCLQKMNRTRKPLTKGGASMAAGIFDGSTLVVGHVGNIHCYLLREGTWSALARPFSYARMWGTGFSLENLKKWDFPTMALGFKDDLEPELFELKVQNGDKIAFFTSGFDQELAKGLTENSKLKTQLAQGVSTSTDATLLAVVVGGGLEP